MLECQVSKCVDDRQTDRQTNRPTDQPRYRTDLSSVKNRDRAIYQQPRCQANYFTVLTYKSKIAHLNF